MPGPLPAPAETRVRRNAPTIPTTNLPAGGRRGSVPEPPEWVELGRTGLAWWDWAWRTPQACGWSAGDDSLIARRASLEDSVAAVQIDSFDEIVPDILNAEDFREVRVIVGHLSSLVSGRLALYREQREIDDRLGLTPKGLAALRWKIISDDSYYPGPKKQAAADGKVTDINAKSRRSRLSEE